MILINSVRRLFRTRGSVQVAPEVFFKARLLSPQKRVCHGDEAHVMMPSQPLAALVMVQPQFLLQFTVILFHPPARLGGAHGLPQPWRSLAQLDHPVLGRLFLLLGPFDQQPFLHPRGMSLLPPAVGGPDRQQGETGALRSSTTLTPSH